MLQRLLNSLRRTIGQVRSQLRNRRILRLALAVATPIFAFQNCSGGFAPRVSDDAAPISIGPLPIGPLGFGDSAQAAAQDAALSFIASLPSGYGGGGSNFLMYDVGRPCADGNWSNGSVRMVVPAYHLNPGYVRAIMQQLRKSGQDQISFVLYYMPFEDVEAEGVACKDASGADVPMSEIPGTRGSVINSTGGAMPAQIRQNLQDVMRAASDFGFKRVIVRFAPQGRAEPGCGYAKLDAAAEAACVWHAWNEAIYLDSFRFIQDARAAVESVLGATSVKRLYDLGVEMAGPNPTYDPAHIDPHQLGAYTSRLWRDYVAAYGKADTVGFSVNPNALHAIAHAIPIYDASNGIRPDSWAVDIYGVNVYNQSTGALISSDALDSVQRVRDDLAGAGELGKPVTLLETWVNSPIERQRIFNKAFQVGLNLGSIFQWQSAYLINPGQKTEAQSYRYVLPSDFSAYGGRPDPTGTIVGEPCQLAAGQTVCTGKVHWATSQASNVSVWVNGQLMAADAQGSVDVPWLSSTLSAFELRMDGYGVLDHMSLRAGVPQTVKILIGAFGCSGLTCASVQALGLPTSSASIQITTSTFSWSQIRSFTLTDAQRSGKTISFTLTDAELQARAAGGLVVTVTSSESGSWDSIVIPRP